MMMNFKKTVFLLIILLHNIIIPISNVRKQHEMRGIEHRFQSSLSSKSTSTMVKVLRAFEVFKKYENPKKSVDYSYLIDKKYHGQTPLHYSVRTNDMSKLTLLLQFGADVDIKDFRGKTALDYALSSRRINREIVDILVDAGAHIPDQLDQNVTILTTSFEDVHFEK